MELLHKYNNGNANISIYKDGTREVDFPDSGLNLHYPLNIDIRLMTRCQFGRNPLTGKSVCSFCHESATTDGKDGDYATLLDKLAELPAGVELAVGMNEYNLQVRHFLEVCKYRGHIVNVTVNQMLLGKTTPVLLELISEGLIKGLGISYRNSRLLPKELVEYENTVIHVILGIDDIHDVAELSNQGIRKILLLGEKDFGFNKGNVNLNSKKHKDWYNKLPQLFYFFPVVSFDNLALQQLEIQKRISKEDWVALYNGEYSFYIDAVAGTYSPSSRSPDRTSWKDLSISGYFQKLTSQKAA